MELDDFLTQAQSDEPFTPDETVPIVKTSIAAAISEDTIPF